MNEPFPTPEVSVDTNKVPDGRRAINVGGMEEKKVTSPLSSDEEKNTPSRSYISKSNLEKSITTIHGATEEQTRLYEGFADEWQSKFLQGIEDESVIKNRLGKLRHIIEALSGTYVWPKQERGVEEMRQLFNAYTEIYAYTQSLPIDHKKNIRGNSGSVTDIFGEGAWQAGLNLHSADQVRKIFEIYKKTVETEDKEALAVLSRSVISYGRSHVFTGDTVQGFVAKLLPAIEKKDPQVALLIRGGNIWGMRKGDFGVADFVCQAYTSPVDPPHLNKLLLISREVPATSLARLEQNRKDALSLAVPFGILRDFIHDQRPYVHEVIKAMVYYYDTGDNSKLLTILPKTDYLKSQESQNRVLDMANYDKVATEVIQESWGGENSEIENKRLPAITFLRRLLTNTTPFEETPPQTTEQEINQKTEVFYKDAITNRLSPQALAGLMDAITVRLETMMEKREVGIEPNLVLLLGWLERKGFEVLKNMKYEDQISAYKQGWFSSILRFNEMITSSDNFNVKEFEDFLRRIKECASFEMAYKLIGKRVLEHTYNLAKKYKAEGKEDTGVLWSGNITHELIGLVAFREPTTEQGKKAVIEKERQRIEPGYHPGD